MAPYGKPIGYVRLKVQDDAAGKTGCGCHHDDGRQIAGAQKGDTQERYKEDQRRTEIAHQCQTSHAVSGEQHRKNQVSLGKEPVQRSGACQDKGNFDKFRWLESDRADGHPVFGAENTLAQHQIKGQQSGCRHSHRPAQLDRQAQIAQDQA